jgi:hypothetical protein
VELSLLERTPALARWMHKRKDRLWIHEVLIVAYDAVLHALSRGGVLASWAGGTKKNDILSASAI